MAGHSEISPTTINASAANVVNTSGQKGDLTIHTCRIQQFLLQQ